jgi:cytochrome c oxidase subunit IV
LSDRVVSSKFYVAVFAALLCLTAATVWAAGQDFGAYNTVVAVGIAMAKATLVILFFMHVRWAGKLVQLFVASGFIWLVILIAITLADYVSRGWSLTSAP